MAGLGAGGGAGGGGPLAGLGALVAGNGLLAVAAGLIVGVVGSGTLLATGVVHVGGGTAAPVTSAVGLQLVACPDVGPVIGTIPRGEKVLVTAKSADGGWLQVFYPGPAFDRAWTKAGPLRLKADATGLPIAACEAPPTPTPRPTPEASPVVEPSPEASPSAEPSPSAAASPSPSPSATPSAKPSPSPTPTPTPNVAPSITGLTALTRTLSYDQGAYCPTAPKSTAISARVTDADGIASVTLFFKRPGTTTYVQKPMQLSNGRYVATLDTTADNIRKAGNLAYYVVAKDANASPKTTRSPTSGAITVAVKVCLNTGPTFTNGPSAGDSTLYADPLNAGCGSPIGTEIRATITDIDGVKSATLVFTDQAGRTVNRPMSGFASNLWTSFINANNDGTQAGGVFAWSVVAVDGKGATTRSRLTTIGVTRCDTPASFDFGSVTSPVYNAPACTPNRLTIQVYASDRDNTAAGDGDSSRLQVIVAWQATNQRTGRAVAGQAVAVFQKGKLFLASFPITADWQATIYSLTYTATSTDVYGGPSRSFTGKTQFSVYSCQTPG